MLALLDESTPDVGGGVLYILGGVALETDDDELRAAAQTVLVPGRKKPFSWHSEGIQARTAMVDLMIDQGAIAEVAAHRLPDLVRLFSELVRLETELWNAVDARLRGDLGLPLSRFEPMQVIGRRTACRVQDIAAELAITVGGTSKLVDRIEAAGHCRRRPHPADRRSSLIELTPAGRRLLARATADLEEELELQLAALSDTAATELTATLTTLRSAGHRARATEETD